MKTLIKYPIITEKSMQAASLGWYTFAVNKESHKIDIASAINDQFKVHVTDIKTLIVKGRLKTVGRRSKHTVKSSDWKKAIVRLKKDEKIDLFAVEQKK